jgi:hypothetical protein
VPPERTAARTLPAGPHCPAPDPGVLADDRRPSFEGWLDRKLDGLGREAGSWLRAMHGGGPRSRARSIETVRCHMNNGACVTRAPSRKIEYRNVGVADWPRHAHT